MNKTEFLNSSSIQDFVEWISLELDAPGSFEHKYVMRRPKGRVWICNSIFSAFENYNWPFTCRHPLSNSPIKGNTFEESKTLLDELAEGLHDSIYQDNIELCQKYCFAVLEWGGVLPKNRNKVLNIGSNISMYLRNTGNRLNPDTFDTEDYNEDIIMNAGFTKIYSLLIDNFVIYDGRVGAALGLLVRKFCDEKGLLNIPAELLFAYGNARGKYDATVQNRRNPSNKKYRFPVLGNVYWKHTDNNLRANWLLKEIIDKTDSGFKGLNPSFQLRAFEAALFMIGYDVLEVETS